MPGHTGDALAVAEQVPAVCDVLATIESRDWPRLERLLDPDVHWTTAIEEHLHGPAEVIALLTRRPSPGAAGVPRNARWAGRALDRHPRLRSPGPGDLQVTHATTDLPIRG